MPIEPDANVVPDYASFMRLDGQVHVVLGAGQGIGYQSAHALAAYGATVVCVDREDERAKAVAAEVGGVPYVGELTSRESVAAIFDFVEKELGRLDGVVDIVGLARYKALVDLTDDDWQWHLDIVLKHAYLAIEYAARFWQRTGTSGAIAVVASVAGLQSSPKLAAYGAMKAALMSLVRTSAVELGPAGIRVNAVAPGTVRTPRAQANPKWTQELLDSNVAKTPTGRLSYPADIATALLFLVSPLSRQITGETLVVDGGNMILFNVDSPTP
ncbi:SDR family NAD(P)-dependent oxidoreductase [Nocardia alni]|uniref:SDR family NAD(P)-dependent oxidoreductase n=1 Tax=Nocardia alni TaxID=2815723 RepID=UPI001C2256FE|nr:SDR family oxidoreductase [Nocardia alni]